VDTLVIKQQSRLIDLTPLGFRNQFERSSISSEHLPVVCLHSFLVCGALYIEGEQENQIKHNGQRESWKWSGEAIYQRN